MRTDPESAKKTVKLSVFLMLSGSLHAKAAADDVEIDTRYHTGLNKVIF